MTTMCTEKRDGKTTFPSQEHSPSLSYRHSHFSERPVHVSITLSERARLTEFRPVCLGLGKTVCSFLRTEFAGRKGRKSENPNTACFSQLSRGGEIIEKNGWIGVLVDCCGVVVGSLEACGKWPTLPSGGSRLTCTWKIRNDRVIIQPLLRLNCTFS